MNKNTFITLQRKLLFNLKNIIFMKKMKSFFKRLSMAFTTISVAALCSVWLVSCDDEVAVAHVSASLQDEVLSFQSGEVKQIPLEDALATLEDFLQTNEQDMRSTRSGSSRQIADVITYYGVGNSTRGVSGGIPDAYLVNFEDEGGFAVLGANNAVPKIVAVTEDGRILDDLTIVHKNEDGYIDDGTDDLDDFDWYCEEDRDYYTASSAINSDLIRNGLARRMIDDGSEVCVTDGAKVTSMPEKSPLLKTNWGQDIYGYNKYCYRDNGKKQVKTGCSATAMAMIVAYNEFPNSLEVNGKQLCWQKMKNSPYIENLSVEGMDDVARLMGSIFNHVKKTFWQEYTLITPEQIKKRMQEFGYTNVIKYMDDELSNDMNVAIAQMLSDDKPVFISAIPENIYFSKAHSWVIDGSKFLYSAYNECLLHFNFGWYGNSNGYFSTACLNPAKAVSYDNTAKNNTLNKDYTYTWHFRIITYDVPTTSEPISVTF